MGKEGAAIGAVHHPLPVAGGNRRVTSNEPSSEELAWQAQRGCQASFAQLVGRHAPGLQTFLRRRIGDRHAAEDLVQDTFIRAYQNLGRYDRSWKFSTWLFTIASRLAANHRRRGSCQPRDLRRWGHAAAPDEAAMKKERGAGLWAAAAELPDSQYEALWLRYGQDMSVKEIAAAMRRSQVCVKVLLYRARVTLAQRLNEHTPNEDLRL